MVLLPPYLKDRRSSGRTFRSMQSGGAMSGMGTSSAGSAQRFLPLQNVSSTYSTSAVSSPTGIRTSGLTSLGSNSNVVQLRAVDTVDGAQPIRTPLATSAAAYLDEAPMADESVLHQAWDTKDSAGMGLPRSTAAARERRRHVLLALTGTALATLLLAIYQGGNWVAAHVLVDVVMVGYVILLVRHRQLAADRMMKVEPIRPPVSEQLPASVQLAPSYLLQSNTGS